MHRERAPGRHQVADAIELHGRQGIARGDNPDVQVGIDQVAEFQRQRAVTEVEQMRVHPTMRCGSQVMMPGNA